METVVAALKDTPIPTIFVVGGMAFLLLAIAGQLAGRIAVAPERQRWAALIGGGLLAIGLALHIAPQLQSRGTSAVTEEGSPSQPARPPKEPPSQPTGAPQSIQPPSGPLVEGSTEEKEPNNDITTATVIAEGTTVRGSIRTDEDQDFFRFNPSSSKTRVLVRTRSALNFMVMVVVYDHVEKVISMHPATAIAPATFSFESAPASIYYIMVKTPGIGAPGNYELEVRKE